MITSLIPKLPFIDKKKTVDFYQLLGFTLTSDYVDYILMTSERTELHFFSYPTLKPDKSDFMIYLRVEEIEKLYQQVQQKGIAIHPNGPLEEKPWSQMEFVILDPNGTMLTFGQSIK